MRLTLSDIAAALGVKALGDASLSITGLAEPADAGPRDLALAMDKKYSGDVQTGQAQAAVLWDGADWQALGLKGAIVVARAGAAMPELTRLLAPPLAIEPGIHASAVIGAGAKIGAGAAIGPFVSIGADAVIGENACIASHVSIGKAVKIGANCLLHSGVHIYADVRIGNNFICHSNTTIGSDGFSFKSVESVSAVEKLRETVGTNAVQDTDIQGTSQWSRVYSLGGVEIGDDCEVGANTSIDRGTIRATSIGRGTKIDNQVQIGHNSEVGEDCLLCGSSGLAGSVKLGNRVVLGGQTGVADNLTIGDNVISGAASAIFSNVPKGRAVWGSPAVKMETQIAIYKSWRRLPKMVNDFRALGKDVAQLLERDRDKS